MTQNEIDLTVKKLEKVKVNLFGMIEDLDATYSMCSKCRRKTYSNRVESLLRVAMRNMVGRIELDIDKLKRNGYDETDDHSHTEE